MLSKVLSAAVIGMDALPIDVEVDSFLGVPAINIVGLADTAVKESKERVRSGISNSGFEFPLRKITVNLAPADIRKEGPFYDLPIALGILAATEQIPIDKLDKYLIVGELSLTGELRKVPGALIIAQSAKYYGKQGVILPKENAAEALIVDGIEIVAAESLNEVINFLKNEKSSISSSSNVNFRSINNQNENEFEASASLDFADVKGQMHVKRALEVAAAGGHNILMIGPPGSGKTMLAARLPSILPKLSLEEAIEVTKIYSIAGMIKNGQSLITTRPFREPHHTISHAGLIGGGSHPRPGEVSLAHNGILFLDEFPEFSKGVLQVLRQPLEEGRVTISRASGSLTYPARFTLVAAMNPCPCGHLNDTRKQCICNPYQIIKYRGKISGPLLDRIDIHVEVPRISKEEMLSAADGERSQNIKQRIEKTRLIQENRFKDNGITKLLTNAQMKAKEVKLFCKLSKDAHKFLEASIDKFGLSNRAYERVLKVARTIADLADCDYLEVEHVAEALQYRTLDRNYT